MGSFLTARRLVLRPFLVIWFIRVQQILKRLRLTGVNFEAVSRRRLQLSFLVLTSLLLQYLQRSSWEETVVQLSVPVPFLMSIPFVVPYGKTAHMKQLGLSHE